MRRADTLDWGDGIVHNTGEIFRVKADCYNFRADEERSGWGRLKDIVLMQYTGLHDKQGKEIYEGDILNSLYRDDGCEGKYEIVWVDDSMKFMPKRIGEHQQKGVTIYGSDLRRCEIIGNIYENPELLN